jgi:DNA mismatch endonuclease (patch repair protein)
MGGRPFPDVDDRRRRLMARIGREHTLPEVLLRRALHAAGLRFRLQCQDLPGTPDIVLPGRRAAIFVHGCFWHSHSCREGRVPKTRSEYWASKFRRNKDRDAVAECALRAIGWSPIVVWECEAQSLIVLQEIVRQIIELPLQHKTRTPRV